MGVRPKKGVEAAASVGHIPALWYHTHTHIHTHTHTHTHKAFCLMCVCGEMDRKMLSVQKTQRNTHLTCVHVRAHTRTHTHTHTHAHTHTVSVQ